MSVLQARIPFKPRKKVSALSKKSKLDIENEECAPIIPCNRSVVKRHLREDNTDITGN